MKLTLKQIITLFELRYGYDYRLLLSRLQELGAVGTSDELDCECIYPLIKAGYIDANDMKAGYGWDYRFTLTDKARQYLGIGKEYFVAYNPVLQGDRQDTYHDSATLFSSEAKAKEFAAKGKETYGLHVVIEPVTISHDPVGSLLG